MHERSAGIVLEKKGEYLILQYSAGHWDLPKGHVEEGESDEQAALRELKEETGISKVTFVPDFKETIHYFFHREKKRVFKEVVFFLARVDDGKVKLSHEHKDFAWLKVKAALNRLTFDTAKNVVKKANTFLEGRNEES